MSFWSQNLTALSRRFAADPPAWLEALSQRGPWPASAWSQTRHGHARLAVDHTGQARAIESDYNPPKEVERWLGTSAVEGCWAVFGLTGPTVDRSLFQAGAQRIFHIEPRLELWQQLFTLYSLEDLITNPDWIPVAEDPASFEQSFCQHFHPLWQGKFQARDWRATTEGFDELWRPYRQALERALGQVTADASTQARFAGRWYRNQLINLRELPEQTWRTPPPQRVIIAGAGPGLEDRLRDPLCQSWLAGRPDNQSLLLATDTACPALWAQGIRPDLMLCLDGQLPTYRHFVTPFTDGPPLLADLASIPVLRRRGFPVLYYLSGHPLGRLIRPFYPELPTLDGSLGNVTGLGVRLAEGWGATEIHLWGADFSYPWGKTYARGTASFDQAGRQASRYRPIESALSRACYGAPQLQRELDLTGQPRYTTPLLRDYRARLQNRQPLAPQPPLLYLAQRGGAERWRDFSAFWQSALAKLPLPASGQPLMGFFSSLPPAEQQSWQALWPLALAWYRTSAWSAPDSGPIDRNFLAQVRAEAQKFFQD